jgi:hypothetical protein
MTKKANLQHMLCQGIVVSNQGISFVVQKYGLYFVITLNLLVDCSSEIRPLFSHNKQIGRIKSPRVVCSSEIRPLYSRNKQIGRIKSPRVVCEFGLRLHLRL